MRRSLPALSMAAAAAISVVVPGTASAIEFELDYGTKVSGGPPSATRCTDAIAEVKVCYEPYGDKWWVQDRKSDGKSAIVEWQNRTSVRLHRYGRCVNSHGTGTWAVCNKNYYEDSNITGYQGVWNRSSGADPVLYNPRTTFQSGYIEA